MNHPACSLQLLVLTVPSPQPCSVHGSKETSDPISRASLRRYFSSPSRRAMHRSQKGWPTGTVLAVAACRHAEKSAVVEKQQNSTGFGGGEDSSDDKLIPPSPLTACSRSAIHRAPADSTVRTRGPRSRLGTQRLGWGEQVSASIRGDPKPPPAPGTDPTWMNRVCFLSPKGCLPSHKLVLLIPGFLMLPRGGPTPWDATSPHRSPFFPPAMRNRCSDFISGRSGLVLALSRQK